MIAIAVLFGSLVVLNEFTGLGFPIALFVIIMLLLNTNAVDYVSRFLRWSSGAITE